MPSPHGSARSNGKVSPIDDAPDPQARDAVMEKELENGNMTIFVADEPKGTVPQPEKSNFFKRLFKKKSENEKGVEETPEKKKPDQPKLKIFEIVSFRTQF